MQTTVMVVGLLVVLAAFHAHLFVELNGKVVDPFMDEPFHVWQVLQFTDIDREDHPCAERFWWPLWTTSLRTIDFSPDKQRSEAVSELWTTTERLSGDYDARKHCYHPKISTPPVLYVFIALYWFVVRGLVSSSPLTIFRSFNALLAFFTLLLIHTLHKQGSDPVLLDLDLDLDLDLNQTLSPLDATIDSDRRKGKKEGRQ